MTTFWPGKNKVKNLDISQEKSLVNKMGPRIIETKRKNSGLYRAFDTDESIKARNDLITAHSGLIASEARNLVSKYPYLDMATTYNALFLAAIECMRSYNEERGRVSTWILTSIQTSKRDHTLREGAIVSTPTSGIFRANIGKYKKQVRYEENKYGELSEERKREIAKNIGINYQHLLIAINGTNLSSTSDINDDVEYEEHNEEHDKIYTVGRYKFYAEDLSKLNEQLTKNERSVMGYMANEKEPYIAYTKKCKNIPPMTKLEFAKNVLSLYEKVDKLRIK